MLNIACDLLPGCTEFVEDTEVIQNVFLQNQPLSLQPYQAFSHTLIKYYCKGLNIKCSTKLTPLTALYSASHFPMAPFCSLCSLLPCFAPLISTDSKLLWLPPMVLRLVSDLTTWQPDLSAHLYRFLSSSTVTRALPSCASFPVSDELLAPVHCLHFLPES